MSNIKVIDESEIDLSKGQVLDFGQDDEIDPVNLPDADEILDKVIEILEFMDNDEILNLRRDNNPAFTSTMETKFEDFAEKYYSVFRMVISGADISLLFEMLKVIKGMKSGEVSVENGEARVGKKLKKFLPEGIEEKLQNETIKNMGKGKGKR